MPSSESQAELIRQTYSRAGLDPLLETDRCQFFEAHGTGTFISLVHHGFTSTVTLTVD